MAQPPDDCAELQCDAGGQEKQVHHDRVADGQPGGGRVIYDMHGPHLLLTCQENELPQSSIVLCICRYSSFSLTLVIGQALQLVRDSSDPAASHNCYAYKIGDEFRSSDDGEPGGTAGPPILNAITGEGLNGVCVLVTRCIFLDIEQDTLQHLLYVRLVQRGSVKRTCACCLRPALSDPERGSQAFRWYKAGSWRPDPRVRSRGTRVPPRSRALHSAAVAMSAFQGEAGTAHNPKHIFKEKGTWSVSC